MSKDYRIRHIQQCPWSRSLHIRPRGKKFFYGYHLFPTSRKKFLLTQLEEKIFYPGKEFDLALIDHMEEGELLEMARDEVVNPHTLAEVIAGARQIADGKF